ncbi:hypothetical protein KSP39_PZI019371 [Platanthera zijinensis]|uniref:CCHC-type domain-containing protein n=1 Tax=Platanthera zijinensis TaxID=2320716 RepID=A0AAP0B2M8_9ASPA
MSKGSNLSSPIPMIKVVKFSNSWYSAWKRNIQFNMKYLNIFYTVQSDFESYRGREDEVNWINDKIFCRDYLLNCLSNKLVETYNKMKTAKEIWDALEEQFKEQENMSKTHLVDKFMAFTFTEERKILPQVADFETLVDKLNSENIPLSYGFIAGAIIFKLPSAWYSFKTKMYQKKMQVSLKGLKRFICIEDENRTRHTLETVSKQTSAANMLTYPKHKPKLEKTRSPASAPAVAATNKKIKKFKGKCYNCNKWGHYASECKQPKKSESSTLKTDNKANMVYQTAPTNFVAMVGKGKASSEWWLDSGATCHVCNNSALLEVVKEVKETVIIANGTVTDMLRVGNATLTLSSGITGFLCTKYWLRKTLKQRKIALSQAITWTVDVDVSHDPHIAAHEVTFQRHRGAISLSPRNIPRSPHSPLRSKNSRDVCHVSIHGEFPLSRGVNATEGDNVKDSKLFQLESEFEKFRMEVDEDIDSMYTRFTKIVNDSKVLEYMEPKKKGLALRSKKEEGSDSKEEEEDEESLFVRKFKKFMRNPERRNSFKKYFKKETFRKKKRKDDDEDEERPPPECYHCNKIGYIRSKCPKYLKEIKEKKHKGKKKVLKAKIWDDTTSEGASSSSSSEEEEANMCLIGKSVISDDECSVQSDTEIHDLTLAMKKFGIGQRSLDMILGYQCHGSGRFGLGYTTGSYRLAITPIVDDNEKSIKSGFKNSNVNKVSNTASSSSKVQRSYTLISSLHVPNAIGLVTPQTRAGGKEKAKDKEDVWYLNSACSKHMTGNKEKFLSLEMKKGGVVTFGDNGSLGKFDEKCDEGIFIGYSSTSKAYRIFNKRTKIVEESIHVRFDEFVPCVEKKTTWKEDEPLPLMENGDEELGGNEEEREEEREEEEREEYMPPSELRFSKDHPKELIIGDPHKGIERALVTLVTLSARHLFLGRVGNKILLPSTIEAGKSSLEVGVVSLALWVRLIECRGGSLTGLPHSRSSSGVGFSFIPFTRNFMNFRNPECLRLCSSLISSTISLRSSMDSRKDPPLRSGCLEEEAALGDGALAGSTSKVEDVKVVLIAQFSMTYLGVVKTILGMEVNFTEKGITLSQSHYIRNLLEKWGYVNSKKIETPYDYKNKLKLNEGSPIRQLDYSKLMGSLIYATTCTRTDIAFTVGMLSRFTSNLGKDHWDFLERLMRYLKYIEKYVLCYSGILLCLMGILTPPSAQKLLIVDPIMVLCLHKEEEQ